MADTLGSHQLSVALLAALALPICLTTMETPVDVIVYAGAIYYRFSFVNQPMMYFFIGKKSAATATFSSF